MAHSHVFHTRAVFDRVAHVLQFENKTIKAVGGSNSLFHIFAYHTTNGKEMTENDQQMFLSLLTVTYFTDTLEDLVLETDALKTTAANYNCRFTELYFQQERAFNTAMPYGLRRIESVRTMLTKSLTALVPFNTQEILIPGGICYGRNAVTGNLIIGLRTSLAHQSATIRQHGKGMIILETALETAGLTYVFPDGNGIKNIAFQVKRREIYALYGGHHAGKSVLLQTIIGTLRPQAGTLKLFGNIDYQKERRRIGFVPQKPVTIGSLSPADMLRYFSSVFGTTEIHILDILHLNLKEKKAVRRLPLSTQRLVNLAVALLGNPDMIILDDPFSGLDKGECEHLLSVLNYLHEINHTTLLISGQDYTLLSRLASKYGVMADGKLLCELTAGELKESCQRCIKIRTPQLERAITILSQQFPDFEVLGHDLIRIFHCNEQSGEINTLLVHSGIEVSEIWLAGMEPTDYLLKMTGGAKSDSDDAK